MTSIKKVTTFDAQAIFKKNELEALAPVLNPIAKAVGLPSFYQVIDKNAKGASKFGLKDEDTCNQLATSLLLSIQNGSIVQDLQNQVMDTLNKKASYIEYKKAVQELKAKFRR